MRLFAITSVVMVAFAANSILNRAALSGNHVGSLDFALLRVASGAAMLALLAGRTGGRRWLGAFRAIEYRRADGLCPRVLRSPILALLRGRER